MKSILSLCTPIPVLFLGGLVLGGILLGGCGSETGAPQENSPTGAPKSAVFPRTIEVFEGQTLELPARPVRVLPANGGALDFLLGLASPERIVALSPITLEYSVGAHEMGVDESLSERATLGEWSVESALTVAPDLVLAGSWQDEKILSALERAKVPLLRLPDVTSFADIASILEVLGRALGEEARAAEVIAELSRKVESLESASMPEGLRALSYSNFGSGGSTAGSGTTYDMMISLARLENVSATQGKKGFESLNLEELMTLDPDWILVGRGDDNPGLGASEKHLRETPGFDKIPAVAGGRFLRLESRVYSTNSQWLVEGARRLQEQVLASTSER